MAKPRSSTRADAPRSPDDAARAEAQRLREIDPSGGRREYHVTCPMHGVPLSARGFCAVAEAYWFPRFACPDCRAELRDDGFCPRCTPRTLELPGDCYVQSWDVPREDPGYGHYALDHKGPSPVVVADFAALKRRLLGALPGVPALREPGDEAPADVAEVPF